MNLSIPLEMATGFSSASAQRFGYSAGTKAAVGIAMLFGVWVTYSTGSPAAALFPLVFAALFAVTLRSGFEIGPEGLVETTWRGRKTLKAEDFIGFETLDDSSRKGGLLLRFRTGIVVVSDARGCSDPDAVRQYVEQHWAMVPVADQRETAGPILGSLQFRYETLHVALLGIVTVALAGVAALGPMFWAAGLLAFFTGSTLYAVLSCRRIEADGHGVSVTRPFQPRLTIPWGTISAVRYHYTPAQGYLSISDGSRTIRVYRWIRDYPRLNRMVQDNAPSLAFSAAPALPWKVSLDRGRTGSWIVLLFASAVSAWLWSVDAWPAALLFTGIPLIVFLVTTALSARSLEIRSDGLVLTHRRGFSTSNVVYRRESLTDMRLGRQLTAGGLWLKFGTERLEVSNLDSEAPPEEILALLRREWQWDSAATRPSQIKAA